MIISDEYEKYDTSYKIVSYKTDKKGESIPIYDMPPIAGKEKLADVLYYTKNIELKRLALEIFEGKISPIKMLMDIQNMNIEDIAHRMKISVSKAKSHLTLDGFKKISVETLQKYANIFDISVGDFFQYIYLKKDTSVDQQEFNERLFQTLNINIKKTGKKGNLK